MIQFPLPVMPYANESFSFESYFGIIKLYVCVLRETIPKKFFPNFVTFNMISFLM